MITFPMDGDYSRRVGFHLLEPGCAALECNNFLIVRTAARHRGVLPAKWGLLDMPSDDVVVSALKPSKDGGTVLRVYEAAGQFSSGIRANWHALLSEVHEANPGQ